MKIPDIHGLVSIAKGVLDPKRQPSVQQKPVTPGADKVELSTQSQAIQRLAAERPDDKARASFVAELKAQYERGELAADSHKTAEAMVNDGLFDDLITGR